jgi:recombination protein U
LSAASHANRGIGWQRLLENWHDHYRAARRAVIFPAPPSVRVLGQVSKTGRFQACFQGDGPPDYAGLVAPTGPGADAGFGLPVTFDAKDCVGERWSLGDLARHQARDLEAWHLAGGLSFVALRFAGLHQAYVLPWSWLGPRFWAWTDGQAVRGEASVTVAAAAAHGWRMPELGDWLGALPAQARGGAR